MRAYRKCSAQTNWVKGMRAKMSSQTGVQESQVHQSMKHYTGIPLRMIVWKKLELVGVRQVGRAEKGKERGPHRHKAAEGMCSHATWEKTGFGEGRRRAIGAEKRMVAEKAGRRESMVQNAA